MPPITITSPAELYSRHAEILAAARRTTATLARLLTKFHGIDLLHRLKFEKVAANPFGSEKEYNFVESLNLSFTALVTLAGVRWILHRHPAALPMHVNLGQAAGHDICCEAAGIAAECFAAVSPNNNKKLQHDRERLLSAHERYRHKYLFLYSPSREPKAPANDGSILVVDLPPDELYFRSPR